MRHRKTEDAIYLVGGALLGVAAMYLLDPDAGARRRRQIAKAAENAYQGAHGAVEDCWDNFSSGTKNMHDTAAQYTGDLADRARHIASGLTDSAAGYIHSGAKTGEGYIDQAQHQGQHLRDIGGRLWDRARHMGEHLRDTVMHRARDTRDDGVDRVKGMGKRISRHAGQAADSTASWLGYKPANEGVSTTAVVTTAVGCCAVGAGMVYFLDPQRGGERRTAVVEKTTDFVRKTGQTMWSTGNHIAQRVQGMLHGSGRQSAASNRADSEALIRRIRFDLANTVDAGQLQLMADADGTITVMGTCPADQAEAILAKIHAVPGVTFIINRLESAARSTAQASSPAPSLRM